MGRWLQAAKLQTQELEVGGATNLRAVQALAYWWRNLGPAYFPGTKDAPTWAEPLDGQVLDGTIEKSATSIMAAAQKPASDLFLKDIARVAEEAGRALDKRAPQVPPPVPLYETNPTLIQAMLTNWMTDQRRKRVPPVPKVPKKPLPPGLTPKPQLPSLPNVPTWVWLLAALYFLKD